MTKQEEIEEGTLAVLLEADYEELPKTWWEHRVILILTYLHSQGVVIKVDMELPKNPYPVKKRGNLYVMSDGDYIGRLHAGYKEAQKDMAGYVAVKPLIKEVSNE